MARFETGDMWSVLDETDLFLITMSLITYSTVKLFDWICNYIWSFYKQPRVDLNYPGIGNGGLYEKDVYPIISLLPDCVHVWKYA